MKSLKKYLFLLCFFSIFASNAFTETKPKGILLCDYVYNFLRKKDFHPQAQPLLSNGTNTLPYNIIVNFPSKNTETEDNLYLIFNMEDSYSYLNLFSSIFENLKDKPFNTIILFSYGDKYSIPKNDIVFGSQAFTKSINTNQNNSAYIFYLDENKNSIISGSNGKHSPSWMLKNLFEAFTAAKLTDGLPLSFISQVNHYSFTNNHTVQAFLDADIPCICANIKKMEQTPENNSQIETLINYCIDSYSLSQNLQNDSHCLMFRLFGKCFLFSEYTIVKFLIAISILSLIFIFLLGFVNNNLRLESWNKIKKNWYSVPAIIILIIAGSFLGKIFYQLFTKTTNSSLSVFGFIILQIIISSCLVSIFFMFELSYNKNFNARSLDFLLVLVTFANQIIFTLLDISLFPLFVMICVISLISLIFKRNWIHIILFILLIFPFIPYVNTLFETSDTEKLYKMLISSNNLPFVIALILTPIYLICLRILTAIKKRFKSKKLFAITIVCIYIFTSSMLIIFNKRFYSVQKNNSNNIQLTNSQNSDLISFSYSDQNIFADIIRNIHIETKKEPVYVGLTVTSPEESPVLYSENEYESISQSMIYFPLPLYPSKNIEFNYGTNSKNQNISVELIYLDENGIYTSVVKEIDIEGIE